MRRWSPPPHPSSDSLGRYRDMIFYWFAISGVVSLTPFIIYAFVQGRMLMGFTALGIVLVFAIDAAFMHRGRVPPIPPVLVFIPVIATLTVAVVQSGVIGVLWTYPALLLFQFVLGRFRANVLSVTMIGVVSVLAFEHLGPEIGTRTIVTLLLTLVFANVFLGIVLDLQKRLQDHAILDSLTGIFNRRHFESCLDTELARRVRQGTPCSMLLLDIDLFKPINDDLGHVAGDRVLVRVVELLRLTTRPTDQLFRIGGEEFVALLPDTTRDVAGTVAERIRAEVADTAILPGRPVTLSIGLDELYPGDDRSAILRRCDVALYRAKDRGRNRVEFADRPVDPAIPETLTG